LDSEGLQDEFAWAGSHPCLNPNWTFAYFVILAKVQFSMVASPISIGEVRAYFRLGGEWGKLIDNRKLHITGFDNTSTRSAQRHGGSS
jgi:hypothetical protein